MALTVDKQLIKRNYKFARRHTAVYVSDPNFSREYDVVLRDDAGKTHWKFPWKFRDYQTGRVKKRKRAQDEKEEKEENEAADNRWKMDVLLEVNKRWTRMLDRHPPWLDMTVGFYDEKRTVQSETMVRAAANWVLAIDHRLPKKQIPIDLTAGPNWNLYDDGARIEAEAQETEKEEAQVLYRRDILPATYVSENWPINCDLCKCVSSRHLINDKLVFYVTEHETQQVQWKVRWTGPTTLIENIHGHGTVELQPVCSICTAYFTTDRAASHRVNRYLKQSITTVVAELVFQLPGDFYVREDKKNNTHFVALSQLVADYAVPVTEPAVDSSAVSR
jgi:hypothetical protein